MPDLCSQMWKNFLHCRLIVGQQLPQHRMHGRAMFVVGIPSL